MLYYSSIREPTKIMDYHRNFDLKWEEFESFINKYSFQYITIQDSKQSSNPYCRKSKNNKLLKSEILPKVIPPRNVYFESQSRAINEITKKYKLKSFATLKT